MYVTLHLYLMSKITYINKSESFPESYSESYSENLLESLSESLFLLVLDVVIMSKQGPTQLCVDNIKPRQTTP